MTPMRCPHCNSLLAMVDLGPASFIEIKCSKCNTYARLASQVLTTSAR